MANKGRLVAKKEEVLRGFDICPEPSTRPLGGTRPPALEQADGRWSESHRSATNVMNMFELG